MERRNADLVDRRLDADELDFKGFTDFDHSITDPNFVVEGDWADLLNYKGKL